MGVEHVVAAAGNSRDETRGSIIQVHPAQGLRSACHPLAIRLASGKGKGLYLASSLVRVETYVVRLQRPREEWHNLRRVVQMVLVHPFLWTALEQGSRWFAVLRSGSCLQRKAGQRVQKRESIRMPSPFCLWSTETLDPFLNRPLPNNSVDDPLVERVGSDTCLSQLHRPLSGFASW